MNGSITLRGLGRWSVRVPHRGRIDPTRVAEFVPPHYQSRFLSGLIGPSNRMPIGPRLPSAADRLQQMRQRMDAMRSRTRGGSPLH